MKKWKIVYRTPNGNKESVVIEADDRKNVFTELSRRGIKPILITLINTNESQLIAFSRLKKLRIPIFITIIFLFLLWGIKTFVIFQKQDSTSIQVITRNHNASTPENVLLNNKPNSQNLPQISIHTKTNNVIKKRLERGIEVVSCETITNNTSGAIIEKLVLANGKKIQKVHAPKPIFENPCDQLIATVLSVPPGQSLPPLPNLNGIDEEFKKSLQIPIKVNDDDSPKVRELKELVIETRIYLENELKNGGSVMNALLEHQSEMNRISDSRLMAIQQIKKIESEEGLAASIKFAELINESLRSRNIPEVTIPKKSE